MVVSGDLPPAPCSKDVKRRNKKIRMMRKKQLEELISTATRAAHVATDKGFHRVSPEALKCVEILKLMRSLSLSPRLIKETNAFCTLLFLSKNGNPKIRSESRAVVDHWRTILDNRSQ
ncbi:hypothetical protein V5N11_005735 [Cardamine amara subsp. amara]|uniref:TFIIS N-terminal domain-containing protein n=1 Tax=Cardamine amara subsp. amara TaxID=228776 RepID=A0ABD1B6V1_CARAN